MSYVPFNRATLVGRETEYILEAIAGAHISGDGDFSRRCSEHLKRLTGTPGALLVHSCTAALEMSAMLLKCAPGDEVIMPSFTFVSTAAAFALQGATPVFVDVRPDTLNLDERLVEAAITPRTRAIVPVHYAGVGCEMKELVAIAKRHDLSIVEDAAQGLCASYRDQPLGTFGALGTLSFHETKNVTCGEGGALLVNDMELWERAEILREKGTNRSRFFRGQVDKYTWVDVGSSYILSDMAAAFLCAQLEEAERITQRRRDIWGHYHTAFAQLEEDGVVRRPVVPTHCRPNGHLYYLLVANREQRQALLESLAQRGVNSVFHYVPLHSSPAGRRVGRVSGSLRTTDCVSERLVRLPLWHGMSDEQVAQVAEVVVDAAYELGVGAGEAIVP